MGKNNDDLDGNYLGESGYAMLGCSVWSQLEGMQIG